MGSSPRGVLVLGSVALLVAVGGSGASSSSSPHSLRYFYTGLSEPGQGLPQFIVVGYVDDQPFVKYESDGRKMLPQVPWMEEFGKEDPQYWEGQSQRAQGTEPVFRGNLGTLRERFNQQNSTGLHILQFMVGCEVGPDGRLRGGHYQFAYDGEDFLAFDRETVRWTAAEPQAKISKQNLDMRQDISQRVKDYLEGTCVEWLRRYLGYGKEALQRTEAPVARVAHKKGHDGQETLLCQLYGFYPKEIEVTWMKDGEDLKPETWTGGVVPNSDGTYNTWLSIDVDPKEKGSYRCRVGHDSLPEPLNLAWEEPAFYLGLILGSVGLILLIVSIPVGFIALRGKQLKSYAAALTFNLGLILGIVVLILLAAAILVGFIALRGNQRKSYEAASTSDFSLILGSVDLIISAVAILVGVIAFRIKQRMSYAAASRKQLKSYAAASRKQLKSYAAASRKQLKSYAAASSDVGVLCLPPASSVPALEKRPPKDGVEAPPMKHPLENGYKPVLKDGYLRPDSSSSGFSDPGSDSTKEHLCEKITLDYFCHRPPIATFQ